VTGGKAGRGVWCGINAYACHKRVCSACVRVFVSLSNKAKNVEFEIGEGKERAGEGNGKLSPPPDQKRVEIN